MLSARVALLALAVAGIGLAPSPALATPRCTKTCRRDTAACIRTTCALLGGQARQDCVKKCRGIGGCAPIRTLAYVVAECRVDARGAVSHWALNIRRGDCDPVTVMEQTAPEPVPDTGVCSFRNRYGLLSALRGGVQRLAVRPDGSAVVFEVNNEIAVVLRPRLPPDPEQEGFFFVRADGSGLRRLGPASRDNVSIFFPFDNKFGVAIGVWPVLSFSPDGRRVVFTDLGPGPAGETAIQIVTLELAKKLATDRRRQVTRLPLARSLIPGFPATGFAGFLDDETLAFYSYANPDGLNPQGQLITFTVRTDGTGLRALPATGVALPGGHVVPRFAIAGGRASVATLGLPGMAVNPLRGSSGIAEVFLLLSGGRNLLQLTNFHRWDTFGLFVDSTAHRVFFTASADPLGSNPTQNCQMFSIDTLGAHLRQVTHFREADHSVNECSNYYAAPLGCNIGTTAIAREDPETGTILFDSGCDPFGTNPLGVQLFAVREDGSRLRSLTHTKGFVSYPDGSVTEELVSLWDYAPSVR